MANDEKVANVTEAPKADTESEDREALITRGDLDDQDLARLEEAVDAIDFAARRATPERLEKLRSLAARLTDVVEQVARGVRRRSLDAPSLSPDDEKRYDTLVSEGVALAEKGDLEHAREKLEAAVRLDPDEPSGLFNLGVLYGKLAEAVATHNSFTSHVVTEGLYLERAAACYNRFLELEPKNAQALTNLAAILDLQGETALAKETLKKALELDPNETKAKEHLAELEAG